MIILNPQERVRETGESVREMQGEEGFKAGEYQRRLTTTNLRQQMRKHRGPFECVIQIFRLEH